MHTLRLTPLMNKPGRYAGHQAAAASTGECSRGPLAMISTAIAAILDPLLLRFGMPETVLHTSAFIVSFLVTINDFAFLHIAQRVDVRNGMCNSQRVSEINVLL